MNKIFITGGHPTPAFALIDELKNQNLEIYFVGRKHHLEGSKSHSPEFTTLPPTIKFLALSTGRLQRHITTHTIPSILKIPFGILESLYYLIKYRPNLVVSFGSYISTPMVFAAWILGIESITHEQATKVGLANKINSLFVHNFFSAWPLPEIPQAKVIGNLTRKAIFKKNASDSKLSKFLQTDKKIIYITGGSIGSHVINNYIFKMIDELKEYQVIHQLGTANYKDDHKKAERIKSSNYLALPYINEENIGAVMSRADLIISRSGANTTWEIAVLEKLSILIPLPIAGANEQVLNAQRLSDAGSAIVISQSEISENILLGSIKKMFKESTIRKEKAKRFAKTLNLNAAETLSKSVIQYLND